MTRIKNVKNVFYIYAIKRLAYIGSAGSVENYVTGSQLGCGVANLLTEIAPLLLQLRRLDASMPRAIRLGLYTKTTDDPTHAPPQLQGLIDFLTMGEWLRCLGGCKPNPFCPC